MCYPGNAPNVCRIRRSHRRRRSFHDSASLCAFISVFWRLSMAWRSARRSTGRLVTSLVLVAVVLAACAPGRVPWSGEPPAAGLITAPPVASVALAPNLHALKGPLPFPFEENRGQAPAELAYLLHAGAVQVGFAAGGPRFHLTQAARCDARAPSDPGARMPGHSSVDDPAACVDGQFTPARGYGLALELVGADDARPAGSVPSDTVVSYFKGTPDQWLVGVPAFQQVAYPEAWPGIDVRYERAETGLEAAYVLAPGADPSQIHLAWHGAEGAQIDEAGALVLTTPLGTLREAAPVAWQDAPNGQRIAVPVRFDLISNGADGTPVEVGFALGAYDPSRPLTIDPIIQYSGWIGGDNLDYASGVAVDASGAAYVAGGTKSAETHGFPVAVGPDLTYNGGFETCPHCGAPMYDAFIAKVKPDGSGLVYAGYIGGSGNDFANGVAVDNSGAAYVAGSTGSSQATFPVLVGPDLTYNGSGSFIPDDGFVVKVKPDGTGLVYAGYTGGEALDLAIDASGAAYFITPITVKKVMPDGSGFVYTLALTGATLYGIDVDASGAAYVAGQADASFPAAVGPDLTFNGGASDGFVAKLKTDGTGFIYAGFIGGIGNDSAYDVAVDAAGAAYVTGSARSAETSFPVLVGPDLTYNGGGTDTDAFITKVKPDGTGLLYSGYIGGTGDDVGLGVTVDSSGVAYVVGTAASPTGFPTLNGPSSTFGGGLYDTFVATVKSDGAALLSSGFIGGIFQETPGGIAIRSDGTIYIAGDSPSPDFPVKGGPDLTYNGNPGDAFVVQLVTATPTITPTATVTPTVTPTPIGSCSPRPNVRVTTSPSGTGVLTVTIQAGTGGISRLDVGTRAPGLVNASVSVSGGPSNATAPFSFSPSGSPSTVQLTITSQNRNAATTVGLVVADGCGDWPTFVGGGPRSF
jgi:hypothetical protein